MAVLFIRIAICLMAGKSGDKMGSNEYILELNDIYKQFGSLVANDRVNIKVRKNSIHAIVGENGAGKTTLMNILTSVYKMDAGQILLDGREVHFHTPKDAAEAGIGMVHQEFMLYKGMTVLENIIMGNEKSRMGFLNKRRDKKNIEEICEKYQFQLPIDEKIDELPVAMLQQIEIVKVLYREADIFVFDEPTSVLTPQGVRGLFHAFKTLKEKGKTIIFITHKLKEVLEIADYVTVLKDGRVIGTGKKEGLTEEKLAGMMVGREVMLRVDKLPCKKGKKVLEVKNLSVRDANHILRVDHVSFELHEGEILGIAGVAGSGQSEIAAALMGLMTPEAESEIFLNGEDIRKKSVKERRMLGIGYVPQDRMKNGINKKGSVWENAFMGYHLHSGIKKNGLMDFEKIHGFTDDVVDQYRVKIQDNEDIAGTLSGGNIQKLIVGREFSQNKKLLIIEDPTRGVDVGAIEFIWNKIMEISRQGAAVLLISHELNEIMQLSDRILIAYDKKIRSPEHSELLTEEEIGLLMTGGNLSEG